jgi:hypothetical protein
MNATLNVVNSGDMPLEIDNVVDLVLFSTSHFSPPEEFTPLHCELKSSDPSQTPYVIRPGDTRTFQVELPATEKFRELMNSGSMDACLVLRGLDGEELARSDHEPLLPKYLDEPITISYAPFRVVTPANPEEALVLWFPLDGNTNDNGAHRIHGDPFVAVPTVDRFDNHGSAYAFDGDSSAIIVPHDDAMTIRHQITISVWAFPAAQKTQEIVRKGAGIRGEDAAPYSLALSQTGEIVFSLQLSGAPVQLRQAGYPLNRWVHLAAVYDGREMALFVDGRKHMSKFVTGVLHENGASLLIGTRLRLPADTFVGRLDDVRIYDCALPAELIAGLSVAKKK